MTALLATIVAQADVFEIGQNFGNQMLVLLRLFGLVAAAWIVVLVGFKTKALAPTLGAIIIAIPIAVVAADPHILIRLSPL